MNRRAMIVTGVSSLVLASCAETGAPGSIEFPETGQLIIVRHMDRDGADLSALGRARAQALVGALEDLPVDAVYAPGIQRNLDSAAPLASARGLEVERRPQEAPARRLMRETAGRSVVWVGNKGNLRSIWDDAALPGEPPLEYGELFVVRRDPAGVVTVERRTVAP
ncbi:histidine phosphatase family protein [Roseobacteraceae bacterium S113]